MFRIMLFLGGLFLIICAVFLMLVKPLFPDFLSDPLLNNILMVVAAAFFALLGCFSIYRFFKGGFEGFVTTPMAADNVVPRFNPIVRHRGFPFSIYVLPIFTTTGVFGRVFYDFANERSVEFLRPNVVICVIVFWVMALLTDWRRAHLKFSFNGSVLVKHSFFRSERMSLDLKKVANYMFIGRYEGAESDLCLIHEDGKQVMVLPVDRFDFKEVQDWVFKNIPALESSWRRPKKK